ncbi:MAG TPA: biopolymer transporter ExbD [Pyrinomonadaceae bacterium]|jgi:biopolymer transport protein ExbD|nr:biopolymer transporter ExbD [Pyrinomonadaceae bacterium]
MGMSGGGGGGATAVPYINVTPLIDVLLVLLIIFMVVTPLKPSRFEAKIPSEPDPQQDLSQIKPNPLTLVVTIASDLKLKLNQDEMGSVNDTGPMGQRLSALFAQRKEQRAYRPGTEEVERTVFVKAPRSLKYGEVVKVIDAIKGSGANPVGLQIDDLAQ